MVKQEAVQTFDASLVSIFSYISGCTERSAFRTALDSGYALLQLFGKHSITDEYSWQSDFLISIMLQNEWSYGLPLRKMLSQHI